jgi:hypothetical protein
MRKGLSINVIAGVVLALVGVALLLTLFSSQFGGGFGGMFCAAYKGISFAVPGDLMPSPSGCGGQDDTVNTGLRCETADDCAVKIASKIYDCWTKYQGYMTERELCGGLNVVSIQSGGTVTTAMVLSALEDQGLCPTDICHSSCSGSCSGGVGWNQIDFQVSNIEQGDFIVIEYTSASTGGFAADQERVRVK